MAAALALWAHASLAQDLEAAASQAVPLETRIAERDWAVRLRAEATDTSDRTDLLKENPGYASVPARIRAGEIRWLHESRVSVAAWQETWTTKQRQSSRRYGGVFDFPLRDAWNARLRLTRWDEGDLFADATFFHFGVGGMASDRVFSHTEYMRSRFGEAGGTHQVSQYVSWSPGSRLRLGGYGALGKHERRSRHSWYGGGFVGAELVPDWTVLRAEALTGGGPYGRDYAEYRAHLYQRLNDFATLRPDIRLYRQAGGDSESLAFGLKAIVYLSPALDLQAGYRYYERRHGVRMDTAMLGFGMIF